MTASRPWAAMALACAFLLGRDAHADEISELGDFSRETMAETGVRGASVALLRDGRVVWLEAFGVRDERSGEPVTTRTVFQTASLGKVVAAYAALLRVQDGDWTLDMPVRSDRLDVPPGCSPPTLAALLSHSAGLGNDLRAERFASACQPPAPFAYAGQGYLVLQDLFGDASGRAAETFMRRRVFDPLGMSGATYAPPEGSDVATGHADLLYGVVTGKTLGSERLWLAALVVLGVTALVQIGRRARASPDPLRRLVGVIAAGVAALLSGAAVLAILVVPVAPWNDEILLPSSLHASAEDMARFAGELLEPKLASAETRDRLFETRTRIDDRRGWTPGIGVELVPSAAGAVTTYWQWGSNPGFQGLLVLVPERRDAIVVLTNTGGFADVVLDDRGGYVLSRRIAERALGLEGLWSLRGAP